MSRLQLRDDAIIHNLGQYVLCLRAVERDRPITREVKGEERLICSGRTVGGLLLDRVAQDPERVFLVADDGDRTRATYSRAEVLERASALGAFLILRGVGHGDRIHLHMDNREEFLFAWF